ncbi:MAG: hypothetical protein HY961_09025 [Ignavibacteriae bacterium]|nr:hypothetical protein [Ignavibacteriota bacterium]
MLLILRSLFDIMCRHKYPHAHTMPKSPGLSDYLVSAFNAKPKGMLVSPNWIGLAAFGMLGILVSPAFLLLGAGAELAYLLSLGTNERFQKVVQAHQRAQDSANKHVELSSLISKLTPPARTRFEALQQRCRSIMEFYAHQLNVGPGIVDQHAQSLNRFAWIFLQLLFTKEGIVQMIKQSSFTPEFRGKLETEIQQLDARVKADKIAPELQKSLESQRDILKQRLAVLGEAESKLLYIDAELDRIEQQIELLREQAAVSKDSQAIAVRIDSVSSSLGETTEWIKEQQNIFGAVKDVVEEPPSVLGQPIVRSSQSESA